MNTMSDQYRIGPAGSEVPLVCPLTRLPLREKEGCLLAVDETGTEKSRWPRENNSWDLVVGQRFDDATDEGCRCYEIESNTYSTEHFWIPRFREHFPDWKSKPPKLLAIGCGVGPEVDLLCEAGFACFGVDNGNRSAEWPKCKHSEGLLLANAIHLPFEDQTFDAVFCGCVFPHVGVVGDSNQLAESGLEDRQNLANEMVRVLKKDGLVLACSPNRHFPFDIFHGRQVGTYRPRFNPPGSRFLLSVGDYREMFHHAGCGRVDALPVEGFWGFITMRRSWKGRLLSAPIRGVFSLVSHPLFSFLRGTCMVPWIAIGGRRDV
jgi:SAM-dependent methyltransferase